MTCGFLLLLYVQKSACPLCKGGMGPKSKLSKADEELLPETAGEEVPGRKEPVEMVVLEMCVP